MEQEVLKARDLSKSFQGQAALTNVNLTLRAGEIHALMGENGAGKSTLIKLLSGIYQPDSGLLTLDEKPLLLRSNHKAQSVGISTVFQEVNLIPTLSVAENIYVGREPLKNAGLTIDWKKVRSGARSALQRLDLDINIDQPLEDFPIAIQQMVAIARALDQSAKVLILDEATSSLDRHEVEQLFKLLRRLRDDGLAILFVSHFLDQIYEISDRMTILRNGHFVSEHRTQDLDRVSLISQMMGRELNTDSLRSASPLKDSPPPSFVDKTWLRLEELGRKGAIEPLSLSLKSGEALGVAGLLGSGRTELAELLFALKARTSGQIFIDNKVVHLRTPRQAMNRGFAFCPEDRKGQAIFPQLSVRENMILALQAQRGWLRILSPLKQNELTEFYIKALGIKTRNSEQPIETLSGGNQQKVILARCLALDPRLLILDEPTRGVDVGAKVEIQNYILGFLGPEKSILFISSELDEVVRICNEVLVLKDHHQVSRLTGPELSESLIMKAIGAAL